MMTVHCDVYKYQVISIPGAYMYVSLIQLDYSYQLQLHCSYQLIQLTEFDRVREVVNT